MSHTRPIETGNISLKNGEAPLWSHLNHPPKVWMLSPRMKFLFEAFNFLLFAYSAWKLSQSLGSAAPGKIASYSLICAAAIAGICAVRFIKWRPLPERHGKDIYQNCLITDTRVIAYNHDDSPPIDISHRDIHRAELDYEAGSLAMKIYRRSAPHPAILVGSADFQKALSCLNARLSPS